MPFTGQALSGELAGSTLERLHAVNVFWFAWSDFTLRTRSGGLADFWRASCVSVIPLGIAKM